VFRWNHGSVADLAPLIVSPARDASVGLQRARMDQVAGELRGPREPLDECWCQSRDRGPVSQRPIGVVAPARYGLVGEKGARKRTRRDDFPKAVRIVLSQRVGSPGPPRTLHFMSDDKVTDPQNVVLNIGDMLDVNTDYVRDPGAPKKMYSRVLQAFRWPGNRAVMHLRNLEFIAVPEMAAVIGGLPPNAPFGAETAPIIIEDSIVDERIHLGKNVFRQNVQRRSFATNDLDPAIVSSSTRPPQDPVWVPSRKSP